MNKEAPKGITNTFNVSTRMQEVILRKRYKIKKKLIPGGAKTYQLYNLASCHE
jgi:hypothetical protein